MTSLKITVIKSKMLSKCSHLLSLHHWKHSPADSEFLLEDKPDEVKRSTICTDYIIGELKIINVKDYEKGLKVTI